MRTAARAVIELVEMTQRVEQRPLPAVETIDHALPVRQIQLLPEQPSGSLQKNAKRPAKPTFDGGKFYRSGRSKIFSTSVRRLLFLESPRLRQLLAVRLMRPCLALSTIVV